MKIASVTLAAAACVGGLGPDAGNVVLRTDRTAYVATYQKGEGTYRTYGFRVIAELENHSGATVYLASCFPGSPTPTFGVTLVDAEDSWGSGYNGFWACVGHNDQIAVPAGAARVDTLRLTGPNAWDGATKEPFGVLTGLMQLHYQIQTCRGDGACRVPGAGASNTFRVELAPEP